MASSNQEHVSTERRDCFACLGSWSFNAIKENMGLTLKRAGYTSVQTSPINAVGVGMAVIRNLQINGTIIINQLPRRLVTISLELKLNLLMYEPCRRAVRY